MKKEEKVRATPICWKTLLPKIANITIDLRNEVFLIAYGFKVSECEISVIGNDTLEIMTQSGVIYDGGLGYYTDTPKLIDPEDIWYSGTGAYFAVDSKQQRYLKLDKNTGLPYRWDEEQKYKRILALCLLSFT